MLLLLALAGILSSFLCDVAAVKVNPILGCVSTSAAGVWSGVCLFPVWYLGVMCYVHFELLHGWDVLLGQLRWLD